MYNQQLETFIAVAEAGSFSKAGEKLYITSTAVIKQINILEERLQVKLFSRSNKGVALTKAGESFYKDTKYILQYMDDSVRRARQTMHREETVIRIGTSPMTPAQVLLDLWPSLHKECPSLQFQLVPFENTPENAKEILEHLGDHIDMVAGIFDEDLLKQRKCQGLILRREPICLAVSLNHPLSANNRLTMQDLYGQSMMLIRPGAFHEVDLLREELRKQYPKIDLKEFSFYNTEIFNQCEKGESLLMAVKNWENVHPLLKIIPVEWDHSIPFGLLYSAHPSDTVQKCINSIKKIYNLKVHAR
ncbi:LysR family transcriptional regulator [Catenisphaera adipataccumulans]|jgi:DNA-binding transcriptional LysR family regulator|uniref:DNA-binding transcriptional LysR family regulator n=1 Tax=Catenisphaera adipataccumulans TaxID=700500 RepID=A0A7W8CXE9_9FIRM|nr:LysR family transcriptional regulator [Catenisphaera adipataccumulans]MBB5183405.1 DNA-binding transcriptional LysR family regulator [Catenisphaera adipataccumulans]